MRIVSSSLVLATLGLLAACGGGGGASGGGGVEQGPRVTLGASNYETATAEAATASLSMTSMSGMYGALTGAASAGEPDWLALGRKQLDQVPGLMLGGPAVLVGATATQTFGCTGGGTMTVTVADQNGNQALDAGDRATFAFNSCNEAGSIMQGGLGILFNGTVTGDLATDVYRMDVSMSFDHLQVTEGAVVSAANGTMRVVANHTGPQQGTDSLSISAFQASITVGGVTRSATVTDYSSSITYATAEASVTVQGVIGSSTLGNGSVSFRTTSPFLQRYTDAYPYAGAALVEGAGVARATLTTLDNTQVLIALDANGDGTAERSVTRTWASLE